MALERIVTLRTLSVSAFALAATVGAAVAVTIDGQTSTGGLYTVSVAPFAIGDDITLGSTATSAGSLGDFAGVLTGVDFGPGGLTLDTEVGAANAGKSFTFADGVDVFTFTFDTTDVASLVSDSLVFFGLGTITSTTFDPSPGSFNLSVAGIGTSEAPNGFYNLFIASPPENTPEIPLVPLPAAAPLLLGAFGLLALARRRRAA